MSKSKNHNTIYFLTTLSVYLGLVIVGASPQVFAQEKLNKTLKLSKDKSFSCPYNGLINDETEENVNPFNYELANRFVELIEVTDFKILFAKENNEIISLPFFWKQIEFAPYLNKYGELIDHDWNDKTSDWASAAQAGQISELHSLFLTPLSDCFKPSKQKLISNSSDIKIDYDWLNSELRIQKKSELRANELVENLRKFFSTQNSETTNKAVKIFYNYTQVYAENNQVVIVTRLPRASIDSLITGDNKAN